MYCACLRSCGVGLTWSNPFKLIILKTTVAPGWGGGRRFTITCISRVSGYSKRAALGSGHGQGVCLTQPGTNFVAPLCESLQKPWKRGKGTRVIACLLLRFSRTSWVFGVANGGGRDPESGGRLPEEEGLHEYRARPSGRAESRLLFFQLRSLSIQVGRSFFALICARSCFRRLGSWGIGSGAIWSSTLALNREYGYWEFEGISKIFDARIWQIQLFLFFALTLFSSSILLFLAELVSVVWICILSW